MYQDLWAGRYKCASAGLVGTDYNKTDPQLWCPLQKR